MSLEEEIRSVLSDVEAAFSQLNLEKWLESFHATRILVLPTAVLAPSSVKECEAMLGSYIAGLRAKGYNRSTLDKLQTKALTDTTALASVVWSRFANETLIETVGATYLFIKTDHRWKITMVTVHPADA